MRLTTICNLLPTQDSFVCVFLFFSPPFSVFLIWSKMAAAALNGIGLVLGALTLIPFIHSLIPPTPAEFKTNIKIIVGSSGEAGGTDPWVHLCESFSWPGCQSFPGGARSY